MMVMAMMVVVMRVPLIMRIWVPLMTMVLVAMLIV